MTQRKDFKRNNVIITEKIDKKAAQFLPADLPYPYTSKAQYEASFKMPVGAEWNSRTTHQKETMPRVVKKVSDCAHDCSSILTKRSRELSLNRSRGCFESQTITVHACNLRCHHFSGEPLGNDPARPPERQHENRFNHYRR